VGEAPPAAGEGEDPEKQAPVALPGEAPAALSAEQQDAIIRAGYAKSPPTPIAELMVLTGLSRDQIKKRVTRKLKLADPEHQRQAARGLMQKLNDERRAGA
jgi:hypothetical protein